MSDPYQEALADLERSEAWTFDLTSFALGALAVVVVLGLLRLVRRRMEWRRANKESLSPWSPRLVEG